MSRVTCAISIQYVEFVKKYIHDMVMIYGAETWTLTARLVLKFKVASYGKSSGCLYGIESETR
jgi:hypothetical protein